MTRTTSTDVFIAHSSRDSGLATLVAEECREEGLGVFSPGDTRERGEPGLETRREIVESSAVVFLVTRSFVESPHLPLQIGWALGWNKSVYILYDGLERAAIPAYLMQFKRYPIARLKSAIRDIKKGLHPLGDDQRRVLAEIYRDLQVPMDRLLMHPAQVNRLAQQFETRTGLRVPGDRLMQALLRERKRGRLPRVRTAVASSP